MIKNWAVRRSIIDIGTGSKIRMDINISLEAFEKI